jgi:hypothetical protein
MGESEGGFLKLLATIDKRVVYLLLFLVVIGPLLSPIGLQVAVSPGTIQYHQVIDELGPDDIVLLHLGTEYSGWNELAAGTTATVRTVVEKGSKMAIISAHPEATTIPDLIFNSLRSVMEENDYKEGEDVINLGYVFPNAPAVAAAAQDFHSVVKSDWQGNSIEGTFLDEVNTGADITLIIDIQTGIWSREIINHFYVGYQTPIARHNIGVGVPQALADLDAGQLVAVLASLRGGAELETLIGAKGPGVAAMDGFTLAHYMLLIFVVIGNIGYFGYQRPSRRGGRG